MMKEFLEAQGLPYKEVNVQEDVDAQKLAQETGQMGMIKVNDQWVLDFDCLKNSRSIFIKCKKGSL